VYFCLLNFVLWLARVVPSHGPFRYNILSEKIEYNVNTVVIDFDRTCIHHDCDAGILLDCAHDVLIDMFYHIITNTTENKKNQIKLVATAEA